jgi:hypothetical protein
VHEVARCRAILTPSTVISTSAGSSTEVASLVPS